ncbi:type I-C CRISPR-associated protein Cas5 [Collinsella sp. AM41-2BH]|uniref:type I-C CRISPR-associated protein Cas5c n=1 Tax=Collinsella sp. AM41-2BH TaxID=2292320 RepID=UPI000E47AAEB|nr:type I-C CRISPR-associated protein Cas5c [Collinsella sp. AM41-2BH]RHB15745.1 type I-C CRISPR-associated protein Cas5 [Collinsella sp. AM41-2BH]
MGFGIKVLISGDRACFTRPEMKTERVSYDVITPSAARGILEAVYWKPAIAWKIDSIQVVNEIRFDTFRRNELASKLSYQNAKAAYSKNVPVYVDVMADRQQRATMYLKDVAYIVTAHFEMTARAGESDTPEKHYNIALRRLRKGQCFNQPYLGCREFPATVSLVEDGTVESYYQDIDRFDLGFMLYDIDFKNSMEPMFYRAVMKNGVIDTSRREVKR